MLVAKTYPILEKALEEGIEWGMFRFLKHRDEPKVDLESPVIREALKEAILNEIQNRIAEYFDYVHKEYLE